GTTPAEPAVGVAQILPIAAFTSFVATALLTASNNVAPDKDLPVFKYSFIKTASTPVRPVVEVTPSKPSSNACFIVCKLLSLCVYTSSSDISLSSISCSSITSYIFLSSVSHCSISSFTLLNIDTPPLGVAHD